MQTAIEPVALRVRTKDGDWFVQTRDWEWVSAHERMKRQVEARYERLGAWEAQHKPEGYPSGEYWERYRREKYLIPVEYPMPWDHVVFRGAR